MAPRMSCAWRQSRRRLADRASSCRGRTASGNSLRSLVSTAAAASYRLRELDEPAAEGLIAAERVRYLSRIVVRPCCLDLRHVSFAMDAPWRDSPILGSAVAAPTAPFGSGWRANPSTSLSSDRPHGPSG